MKNRVKENPVTKNTTFVIGGMMNEVKMPVLLDKENHFEQLKIFCETYVKAREWPKYFHCLIVQELQQGNYETATEYTEKALALFPDDAALHLLHGIELVELGKKNHIAALSSFDKAKELDTELQAIAPFALSLSGIVCCFMCNPIEARTRINKALELCKGKVVEIPGAKLPLELCLFTLLGDRSEMLHTKYYEKALECAVTDSQKHALNLLIANGCFQGGRYNKAILYYQESLKYKSEKNKFSNLFSLPVSRWVIYDQLADCYRFQEDYEAAETYLQKMLATAGPCKRFVYCSYFVLKMEMDEMEEAVDMLSKAIELDPTAFHMYEFRAQAYEYIDNLPEAKSDYEVSKMREERQDDLPDDEYELWQAMNYEHRKYWEVRWWKFLVNSCVNEESEKSIMERRQ